MVSRRDACIVASYSLSTTINRSPGLSMSSIAVSLIVFGFVFGGALFGMFLRSVLPEHHLNNNSKDVVKLGMGLVATMSALVLSLLISSAKSSFDAQGAEVTEASAKVILLDRALALYGPETKEARELLRSSMTHTFERLWPKNGATPAGFEEPSGGMESVYVKIQAMSPKDDKQRSIQTQALIILVALGQMRWLMYEQQSTSITMPLLIVLVSWVTTLFISFGIFAPFNGTVVGSLLVTSLSVAAAIFLILELYRPYGGLIHISSAPMRLALEHLGQ